MADLIDQYGLVILFGVMALQAAGVPGPPGKTALTVAAVLAADGRLVLWQVLAVAAAAGLAGGAVGYVIGRTGGRRLLERPLLAERVERPLELAERFFDAHGGKALIAARFLPGVKVVITLAAGIVRMRALAFAVWHTVAAVVFALVWGLTAYLAGAAALELIELIGLYALFPLGAAAVALWLLRRRLASPLGRARARLGSTPASRTTAASSASGSDRAPGG